MSFKTANDCNRNEGEVAAINRKRKIDDCLDETNIYMTDTITNRRSSLIGDDNDSYGSSDSENSESSRLSQGLLGADAERSRKTRRCSSSIRRRRLHWSKAPQKDAKYADWKIEIKHFPTAAQPFTETNNDNDGSRESQGTNDNIVNGTALNATESVTYSVHRSSLGIHSEYFERIFLGEFSETVQQKNTIELPAPLITPDHFESVLEYCYTESIEFTCDNVISIIHLSDYLGIEDLCKLAQDFVRGSIHQMISNKSRRFYGDSVFIDSSKELKDKSYRLATLYLNAKSLGIEDLLRAIEYVCSKEPELLVKDCSLIDMSDTEFWSQMWNSRKMHPTQISLSKGFVRAWSENLAHFFEKHPNITDLKTFRQLTHIDSLKRISPNVAIMLMQQEHRLCLNEIDANVYLINKEDTLTCLQKRCLKALYNTKTGGWQISSPPDVIRGKLRKLPSIVLESILLKTIKYERMGQCFPMPVVSGAGSDYVNGVYKMSGWFKNAIKFTRLGVYEENRREFTMYRYEGEWWISIIAEHHDEPGDCEDIDFYSFDSLEEDSSERLLPPPKGWTSCCGDMPAPTIHFLNNEEAKHYNSNRQFS